VCGRQHRQVDLQQCAEGVMAQAQRLELGGRHDARQMAVARPQPQRVGNVETGEIGLGHLEAGCLAEVAGAHQLGFLLHDADERFHHLGEVRDQRRGFRRGGDRGGRGHRRGYGWSGAHR
jgi:hypothetical protein